MKTIILRAATTIFLIVVALQAMADPALSVLRQDFEFPNKIEGLPAKLSDFKELQINSFRTSDGVVLTYWEAGKGAPLIFIPGWSANGAEYINLMYLLAKKYRVIVMDPRNQGLSQNVEYGNRISRFAMDLKELTNHLAIEYADYCGWSMGASVLWSYIDIFGTKSIHKAIFVDEPISIVAHADWSKQVCLDAGAMASSPDEQITMMKAMPPVNLDPSSTNFLVRYMLRDSPYYTNSEAFAQKFIHSDPKYLMQVMYDHAANDWRDVIKNKINIPVAIFTGDYSANVPSQRWAHSVISSSRLYVYSKSEQGDHFLMFKNPKKFAIDLMEFLNGENPRKRDSVMGSEQAVSEPQTEVLVQSKESWNGKSYDAYNNGRPQLSVIRVTIPPHNILPWHTHPIPNAAYIISGHLTVEDRDTGEKKRFAAGEAFAEQRNAVHRGFTDDEPATVIVTYAGTAGMLLSVSVKDIPITEECS